MITLRSDCDVAIVGAGIIGLSIAHELAVRGASVRVFDREEPVGAASWAAAGMLAPRTERISDEALRRLCEESLQLYADFIARIGSASGIDPHLRLDGILHAAYSAQQLSAIRAHAERTAGERRVEILTRTQALLAEPALGKGVHGAVVFRGEGQIDNRRLGRALVAACRARGVQIQTGVAVLSIDFDSRRVLGIRTGFGYVAADIVINAAGAWAAGLRGVPAECDPPVRPVKGQMLAIELPAGFMRRVTWVPGAYLVPRADGRLLVGATVEEAADVRVTAGAMHDLLHAATEAVPALAHFTVSETWAGLRPATPDERPCLGPTARSGYFLATGHHRNGILLAPVTALLIADTIASGTSAPITEFSLDRFGTKAGIA